MTDEQLREDIKRRVDLMGGLPLQVAGRALGAIAGGYVQSEDAGSPWSPVVHVTDGPLWDQDEQASLVEGMRE
jgi:hypothetical protein